MRGFGDNLKRKRTDAGMTQAELERAAGLPATLISQYEHGTRKPGVDAIIALCRGLRCSSDDLLFGSTQHPTTPEGERTCRWFRGPVVGWDTECGRVGREFPSSPDRLCPGCGGKIVEE